MAEVTDLPIIITTTNINQMHDVEYSTFNHA